LEFDAMSMRTPLKNVRHLGSAREGASHFVMQRLTGVANVVLAIFLVWLVTNIAGADYKTARTMLHNPFVAIGLLALIGSGVIHMRLGMQTIIEDYVHTEGAKLVALAANTFFAILIGLSSVFAILKLSFGA
jgi:succinate dehydrogenase / fumarate reductase, membrane anchor subunit